MKYLSMIALALVGAVMIGCSSDDDNIDTPKQPENKDNNVVTLTTTIGRENSDGAKTRALAPTGEKTFAVGEKIAIVYTNTSNQIVKGESEALTESDILESGKEANFTFTLESPDRTKDVTYIYPAAMADANGSVNTGNLATQNGTLAYISSDLDLATYSGAWVDKKSLPVGLLTNQLAILCLALKDNLDVNSLTSSITGLTLSDGTHTYNITRTAGEGPIYVAMLPTSNATIEVTATDGTKTYAKYLTNKTYAASNGYTLAWKMAEVIKGKFSVSSTKQVYFSTGNLQATTSNLGSTWTWAFAANQWDKVGEAAANTSISGTYDSEKGKTLPTTSTNGTVDLFGWSTSKTYLGISYDNDNTNYEGDFVDWASHADVKAAIGDGWRTLAGAEWYHLFFNRNTSSGHRYCKAKVNGVFGVILLPDDWQTSYHSLTQCDVASLTFSDGAIDPSGKISLEEWNSDFVPHGAVFLPTTGQRRLDKHSVDAPDGRLYYWSSTKGDTETGSGANANRVYIDANGVAPNAGGGRKWGYAVRLVRNVQ